MLLNGNVTSNKTGVLVNKYIKLINDGVSVEKILVLTQNSTRKQQFINSVLENLSTDSICKMQVHSFSSLVYNAVNDNWVNLEKINPNKSRHVILPNLVGLEVSQYILKDIIKELEFKGYNSKNLSCISFLEGIPL